MSSPINCSLCGGNGVNMTTCYFNFANKRDRGPIVRNSDLMTNWFAKTGHTFEPLIIPEITLDELKMIPVLDDVIVRYNLRVNINDHEAIVSIETHYAYREDSIELTIKVLSEDPAYPCLNFTIILNNEGKYTSFTNLDSLLYTPAKGIDPNTCKILFKGAEKKISWSDFFLKLTILISRAFDSRFIWLEDVSFIFKCDEEVSLTKFLHMQGKPSIYERVGFMRSNVEIWFDLQMQHTFDKGVEQLKEFNGVYTTKLLKCQSENSKRGKALAIRMNNDEGNACMEFMNDKLCHDVGPYNYILIL